MIWAYSHEEKHRILLTLWRKVVNDEWASVDHDLGDEGALRRSGLALPRDVKEDIREERDELCKTAEDLRFSAQMMEFWIAAVAVYNAKTQELRYKIREFRADDTTTDEFHKFFVRSGMFLLKVYHLTRPLDLNKHRVNLLEELWIKEERWEDIWPASQLLSIIEGIGSIHKPINKSARDDID